MMTPSSFTCRDRAAAAGGGPEVRVCARVAPQAERSHPPHWQRVQAASPTGATTDSVLGGGDEVGGPRAPGSSRALGSSNQSDTRVSQKNQEMRKIVLRVTVRPQTQLSLPPPSLHWVSTWSAGVRVSDWHGLPRGAVVSPSVSQRPPRPLPTDPALATPRGAPLDDELQGTSGRAPGSVGGRQAPGGLPALGSGPTCVRERQSMLALPK